LGCLVGGLRDYFGLVGDWGITLGWWAGLLSWITLGCLVELD